MTLHTTYFGSVDWYRQLLSTDETVYIEAHENYIKQTARNRCEIATANGKQILTVPVSVHVNVPVKDVLVSEHGNWRHQHWEALKSAYGMSPFFDYYQDDIRPFFDEQVFKEKHWEKLFDYNLAIIRKILDLIGENREVKETPSRSPQGGGFIPVPVNVPVHYYQTFQKRHGFIPGLSILDILFNEGPEAILYLK